MPADGRDQFFNAAQVEALGAGRMMSSRRRRRGDRRPGPGHCSGPSLHRTRRRQAGRRDHRRIPGARRRRRRARASRRNNLTRELAADVDPSPHEARQCPSEDARNSGRLHDHRIDASGMITSPAATSISPGSFTAPLVPLYAFCIGRVGVVRARDSVWYSRYVTARPRRSGVFGAACGYFSSGRAAGEGAACAFWPVHPSAPRTARRAWRTLAARSSGLTERRATFREVVTILEHGRTGGDAGMGRESSLGRAGDHLDGAFERVGPFPEVHHHAVRPAT